MIDDDRDVEESMGVTYTKLPVHMRESAKLWVEQAQPHPKLLGDFMQAVLTHNFMRMVRHADNINRAAIVEGWAMWLYNDAPGGCHGDTFEALEKWHELGGLVGLDKRPR